MATYTSNYGLHQWAPEDNFLRTDFNEDLKKIDTALGEKADSSSLSGLQSQINSLDGGKAEVAAGSYVGDSTTNRPIYLGFQPKALWIGIGANVYMVGEVGSFPYARLTSTGFSVDYYGNSSAAPNYTGYTYIYAAIR